MSSVEQTKIVIDSETSQFLASTFIESLKDCFETMLGMECSATDTLKRNDTSDSELEAIASLGLVGDFDAALIIGFTKESATNAVGAMMGGMVPESIEEVCDGIGEIANMVAGGAKTRLDGTIYHFTLSIPSVVLGQYLQVKSKQKVELFQKRYQFGEGCFLRMMLIIDNQ